MNNSPLRGTVDSKRKISRPVNDLNSYRQEGSDVKIKFFILHDKFIFGGLLEVKLLEDKVQVSVSASTG